MSRASIAAERRAIARSLRAEGRTWPAIGAHLGVSAQRAFQLANGRQSRAAPAEPAFTGTIADYITQRAARVRESVEAVTSAVQPKEQS
jgi:hypothetical protein